MSKFIVCTSGTSIATNLGIDKTLAWTNTSWDERDTEFGKVFALELAKFNRQIGNDKNELLKMSTELAVLSNLELSKGDGVALLTSDTAQGRICSEELRKLIIKLFGLDESLVKIERIEGLNTYRHNDFRLIGLKNFVNRIGDLIDRYADYESIINPISGYRNLFPFMTIMGMIYGKKVVYWYELTNTITFLPPLPITFDTEIFNRAFDALKYVENEVIVHRSEYLYRIIDFEPSEEDLFLSFVEPVDDNGNVTVSPLAFTLLKIESERKPVKVLIELKEKLLKDISPTAQCIRQDLTEKVSSPLWRKNHVHVWDKSVTDLTIFKLRNNPMCRIAGFTDKNGDFVMTHYFSDHAYYERTLTGAKISSFQNRKTVQWLSE